MRNVERIGDFLSRFEKCWKKVPDWRFGQFISNVLGNAQANGEISDIFYVEDEKMIHLIEDYFKKYGTSPYTGIEDNQNTEGNSDD